MADPVHPPIVKTYYNDFKRLYDKVIITHSPLNFNQQFFTDLWVHWIKEIDITISLSPRGGNRYVQFDRLFFTEMQREVFYLLYNHRLLTDKNNSCQEEFCLFPFDYLKQSLNYLYGMSDCPDIDYKIDIKIDFNSIAKILNIQNYLDAPLIDFSINFIPLENDLIYEEHMNYWLLGREEYAEKLKNLFQPF